MGLLDELSAYASQYAVKPNMGGLLSDSIQATPRNRILGGVADTMQDIGDYATSPLRTQQMQGMSRGLANLLQLPAVQRTLNEMSYGGAMTTGAGGLGGTTRIRPDVIDTAMTVAPLAGPAIRGGVAAGRAVAPQAGRMAENYMANLGMMPSVVERGGAKTQILDNVTPQIGINVNQGGSEFADKIISGVKKFETRDSDSLRPYVGKRVGIIKTGEGKAKAIGDVTLGEPIVVTSAEEFAKLRDLHLVPEGSKFDIKQGGVKYLYPIENPVPYEIEKDVAKYGILSRKILEDKPPSSFTYPQQAALDLAQQRAALPVEQGGLGLAADNTAMDRAKAMGFDTPSYHSTDATDITNFDMSKLGQNTERNTDSAWAKRLAKSGVWTSEKDLSQLVGADVAYPLLGTSPKYNYKSLDALESRLKSNRLKNPVSVNDEEFNATSYVYPNPENLRSRFAAFDPFRRTAATAALMGVAAPDLLAQPMGLLGD